MSCGNSSIGGESVVVLDNLSTGYPSAVLGAPLVLGDTGDAERVAQLLAEYRVGYGACTSRRTRSSRNP
jgi:UDP-glucose 4-epimerase